MAKYNAVYYFSALCNLTKMQLRVPFKINMSNYFTLITMGIYHQIITIDLMFAFATVMYTKNSIETPQKIGPVREMLEKC